MTDLSPAAQKVLDAAKNAYWLWDQMCPAKAKDIAAAALCAAADQVVPDYCLEHQLNDSEWQTGFTDANCRVRADLLAIAAELEALP